jgi:hypothetical protein
MEKPFRDRQPSLAAMRTTFLRCYERRAAFREDRLLGADLVEQGEPVLEALAEALQPADAPNEGHEAAALLTLLCRRAGLNGATPTACHALVRALVAALEESAVRVPPEVAERLLTVAFEGYVLGRDERLDLAHQEYLARAQVGLELAPACRVLFLVGRCDEARLGEALDELSRTALHAEVLSCLVDISRLELADEELTRVLCDRLATLLSLGPSLVVVVPEGERAAQLECHRAAISSARIVHSFDEGARFALAAAGYELRKGRRRWPKDLFVPKQKRPQGNGR